MAKPETVALAAAFREQHSPQAVQADLRRRVAAQVGQPMRAPRGYIQGQLVRLVDVTDPNF